MFAMSQSCLSGLIFDDGNEMATVISTDDAKSLISLNWSMKQIHPLITLVININNKYYDNL